MIAQDTANGQYAANTIAAHRATLTLIYLRRNGHLPMQMAIDYPGLGPDTIGYLAAIRRQITHEEVTR